MNRRAFLTLLLPLLGLPDAEAQQVLPAPTGLRITKRGKQFFITGTRTRMSNVVDALNRIVFDYGRNDVKPWIQISDVDIERN